MAQIHFDDEKLKNLVRFNYYANRSPNSDPNVAIEKLLEKESFSNADRNFCLSFLDQTKTGKPRSIASMKREVFEKIGYNSNSPWGTVNRSEMEAIYNFIMGTKK